MPNKTTKTMAEFAASYQSSRGYLWRLDGTKLDAKEALEYDEKPLFYGIYLWKKGHSFSGKIDREKALEALSRGKIEPIATVSYIEHSEGVIDGNEVILEYFDLNLEEK